MRGQIEMPKKVSKHKTAKRKGTKRKVARRGGVQRDAVVQSDVVNYSAVFNSIDNALRLDAGCSSELDYVEQTSWILFLKYLDDYETEKEEKAELDGKSYTRIIDGPIRWDAWAAPKDDEGKLDHTKAQTGSDLLDFVNDTLFFYLSRMDIKAGDHQQTLQAKIGEIFSELRNKLQSGVVLRDVINMVDKLKFLSNDDKHELSALYEDKIKSMGNAGRNGGEYYTPRPLIKSIVKVINPKVGETVYDGAAGSAGFLCEAYEYMRNDKKLTTTEYKKLQTKTFYGVEKKSLAYIIGMMNMILHGIESPNIERKNTFGDKVNDILAKDRVDVVLANPPFGGNELAGIRKNFPIETGETAYLFLQYFIKKLKAGGRCGVVIKNTFLSNMGKVDIALRKQLLEDCNLFTVLDLPSGAFLGTGVKTVVLFFEKGKPTKKIWYYQLNPGRKLGKTTPLVESDLAEFVKLASTPKKLGGGGGLSMLVNLTRKLLI